MHHWRLDISNLLQWHDGTFSVPGEICRMLYGITECIVKALCTRHLPFNKPSRGRKSSVMPLAEITDVSVSYGS